MAKAKASETSIGVEEGNTTTASVADLTSTEPADIAELRKPGNTNYTTKQQDKAASGPDGIDQYELAKTQVTKVAKSAVRMPLPRGPADRSSLLHRPDITFPPLSLSLSLAMLKIPDNIQLRKEVLLGLIKSSTVFINYISAAALDKTHEAGNKTMSAQHVLAAFKEMGLPEQYVTQLKKEYNEKLKAEADKTNNKAAAAATAAAAAEDTTDKLGEAEQGGQAMDVDERASGVGEESIAVGDETLAAADAIEAEDEEDEEEGGDGEEDADEQDEEGA